MANELDVECEAPDLPSQAKVVRRLTCFDEDKVPDVDAAYERGVAAGRQQAAEEDVDLRTRLFDAESALAELVRLKDGPRDAAYERDKPIAWSRARAVLAQIAAEESTHAD